MFVVILILHILVALVLMAVVLMQSGKGKGLAGTFGGGGGNQTLFGGRGAVDFLGKATWVLGALFMLTSLTLAMLSSHTGPGGGNGGSVIPKDAVPASAPAIPGGGAPAEPSAIPSESAPATPGQGGN